MRIGQSLIADRVDRFCDDYGLQMPILMAPMAGVSPPALGAAVANAGGLGACGALLMAPDEIAGWCSEFRSRSAGGFQLNLWIPGAAPHRDRSTEAAMQAFLADWGPSVPDSALEARLPDFSKQCDAMIEARPRAISSIMGLYPDSFVRRMHDAGIRWLATVTTVAEARAAEAAGASAIIAQGMEAGGHRGAFRAEEAETNMVGLFALLPAIADAVAIPVIATGGIADGRTIVAALTLGASAVQIGSAYLRTPEAGVAAPWAQALATANPEDTIVTRAFSGRPGRALRTRFVLSVEHPEAPATLPYPLQGFATAAMRARGRTATELDTVQAWAGQSARLAVAAPASEVTRSLWSEAEALLA